MPPLIGVTGYYLDKSETASLGSLGSLGRDLAVMSYDYTRSIERAGGIPVMIPLLDTMDVGSLLDRLDGLLLSGGSDVNPLLYGEQPTTKLGQVVPERDAFELALIRAALERDMPIFAICRGMQILNVALDGTLYQDLETDKGPVHYHAYRQFRKWQPAHPVSVHRDSKLYESVAYEELWVNSYHHQAVKSLGQHLKATAWSKEGVIEAMESTRHGYVAAVQWHPEMMSETDPAEQSLFDHFVSYIKRNQRS
ncbi:gamma-glutamyl-gamma-aminobutyrate hydrolase family protein [Paenibacillus cremeus]|uniref:Gamma-glutamyl-gamma-aminobutyrate hydrolase family protein n=1 Tax=Paenibacillus cremeus TaxID=2163881 RepID=A0A559K8T5_9BACL|nr:gamma-glutamyl-gamma-aminobutyrate hydrolase family protein [Paenibacillus cremeus]TVY08544.1 gamma-glutamyl-gamma-aminobutyrate hydrolase family protein [Paenibacillus cremeus]